MNEISRRSVVQGALASTALSAVSCGGPLKVASELAVPTDLASDVDWMESVTQSEAFARASDAFRAGKSMDQLYAALVLACARQLPLRQLHFETHPLWTVTPARSIGLLGSAADQKLAFLHALDLFKHEQDRSRFSTRPTPPRLLESALPSQATCIDELKAGLEAFDDERADRAVVAAVRSGRFAEARALLLHYGCRSVDQIGHVAIHTMQIIRAAESFGSSGAEALLRALVFGLLGEKDQTYLATWAPNLELARALPAPSGEGPFDVGKSTSLYAALRGKDDSVAVQAVNTARAAGASPRAILDALFVIASELSLQHAGLSGVFPGLHSLTAMNAYRYIFNNTVDPVAKNVVLLQAAVLLTTNRREAERRSGGKQSTQTLDTLEPVTGRTLSEVWQTAASSRMSAAAQLIGHFKGAGTAAAVVAQAKDVALRASDEEHYFKLPRALFDDAPTVAPDLAPLVWAGLLSYGKTGADPDWSRLKEANAIIS